MFEKSIVIAKCPHFYWGIDGNHATCMRYSPFTHEPPECEGCDVYKDIACDKEVEQITTEKHTYMFNIDDTYWTTHEKTMEEPRSRLANREMEGIEDALRECGFVRERTCKLVVKTNERPGKTIFTQWYACSECEHPANPTDKYCSECGARVTEVE